MLTKADVSTQPPTRKVLSELNRLHKLKYKNVPKKDPPNEVLADHELVREELQKCCQIIKYLVNSQNL